MLSAAEKWVAKVFNFTSKEIAEIAKNTWQQTIKNYSWIFQHPVEFWAVYRAEWYKKYMYNTRKALRRIAWSIFLLLYYIFCNLIYQMRALTQSKRMKCLIEKILILMTIDHKYKTSVHWASQYVYLDELITKHFYIGWLWTTRLCCNGFSFWEKGCNFFILFLFVHFTQSKSKRAIQPPDTHTTCTAFFIMLLMLLLFFSFILSFIHFCLFLFFSHHKQQFDIQ